MKGRENYTLEMGYKDYRLSSRNTDSHPIQKVDGCKLSIFWHKAIKETFFLFYFITYRVIDLKKCLTSYPDK